MATQRTPRRAVTEDDEVADDDVYAWSQLHEAVVVEDLDKLIKVLRKKPQCVDTPTSSGSTALHMAATEGYEVMGGLLIDFGADVNARTPDGQTPLHYAAFNGHVDFVRMLVERGADIDQADDQGATALMWAVEGEQVEVVECLVELDCDRELEDIDRGTPLQLAVSESYFEIVRALVVDETDLAQVDWEDNSLLHLAVIKLANQEDDSDAFAVLKFLLERGVDHSLENSDDKTAHQLALDAKCSFHTLLLFADYIHAPSRSSSSSSSASSSFSSPSSSPATLRPRTFPQASLSTSSLPIPSSTTSGSTSTTAGFSLTFRRSSASECPQTSPRIVHVPF